MILTEAGMGRSAGLTNGQCGAEERLRGVSSDRRTGQYCPNLPRGLCRQSMLQTGTSSALRSRPSRP